MMPPANSRDASSLSFPTPRPRLAHDGSSYLRLLLFEHEPALRAALARELATEERRVLVADPLDVPDLMQARELRVDLMIWCSMGRFRDLRTLVLGPFDRGGLVHLRPTREGELVPVLFEGRLPSALSLDELEAAARAAVKSGWLRNLAAARWSTATSLSPAAP